MQVAHFGKGLAMTIRAIIKNEECWGTATPLLAASNQIRDKRVCDPIIESLKVDIPFVSMVNFYFSGVNP
jgi:hypothetical protein